MLMIGTGELAEQLYYTWREMVGRDRSVRVWPPHWEQLTPYKQDVWRRVAERAAHLIEADAQEQGEADVDAAGQ